MIWDWFKTRKRLIEERDAALCVAEALINKLEEAHMQRALEVEQAWQRGRDAERSVR